MEPFDGIVEHRLPGQVLVEIEWIGEGTSGEYDPADPQDAPLVRFTATDLTGALRDRQDASYCTLVPATASKETLCDLAERIARSLAPLAHWKRAGELWSHATLDERGQLLVPLDGSWREGAFGTA